MSPESFSRESIDSVQGKLQGLFDSLGHDERPVLEALLAHAARDAGVDQPERDDEESSIIFQRDREASSIIFQRDREESSIIIVGGRSGSPINIPLQPGALNSLNPQPIPPGRFKKISDTDPLRVHRADKGAS